MSVPWSLMFVHSLSAMWWSGIIRNMSPSLSWWRRTKPSRSTGAGSVSSTVRTARGWTSSTTLWTSDLPERRQEGSGWGQKVWLSLKFYINASMCLTIPLVWSEVDFGSLCRKILTMNLAFEEKIVMFLMQSKVCLLQYNSRI